MPKDKILLNGPINVVRMEGSVGDVHKVIYLFMDRHDDISIQSDCGNVNSIKLMDFFKRSFDGLRNVNKTYDFYMETFPENVYDQDLDFIFMNEDDDKLIYLYKMWKFFRQHVKFDNKDQSIKSVFKNVRFHYLDIRMPLYYFLIYPLDFSLARLNEKDANIKYMVQASIDEMMIFTKRVEEIIRTGKCSSTKQDLIRDSDYDIIKFFFDVDTRKKYLDLFVYSLCKLLNSYHYQDVKNIINNYVHTALLDVLYLLIDALKSFNKKVQKYEMADYHKDDIISELTDELEEISANAFAFSARFLDSYFLRRFLDKDYVTNAIVYTGAAHSVAFIYVLNKMGFKITDCANCPDKNINRVEKMVESIFDLSEENLWKLIHTFVREDQIQCVDLTNFPSNFN